MSVTPAETWVEALRESTYYRVLEERGLSHDEFWRDYAVYDEMIACSGYPGQVAVRVCNLIPAGSRVVDIGAGTGAFALPLGAQGSRVVAVDPSPFHLEILLGKAKASGCGEIRCVEAEWKDIGSDEIGPVDYALAAYSFIDADIGLFLRKMVECASKGIFLVYRAGEPDPLAEFATGHRRSISYRHLVDVLAAMGYDCNVEFFPRDYFLPLDLVERQYRSGVRSPEEIRLFLLEHGRLACTGDGDRVACRTVDALITLSDY
jgi:SAM-dependent methyltransferase